MSASLTDICFWAVRCIVFYSVWGWIVYPSVVCPSACHLGVGRFERCGNAKGFERVLYLLWYPSDVRNRDARFSGWARSFYVVFIGLISLLESPTGVATFRERRFNVVFLLSVHFSCVNLMSGSIVLINTKKLSSSVCLAPSHVYRNRWGHKPECLILKCSDLQQAYGRTG